MNLKIFLLVITCITISALSQMIMKIGMSDAQLQKMLTDGNFTAAIWLTVRNLYVVIGIGMYILGAVLWLFVLSQAELTLVYPFIGVGFILTMLLGWLFLQEHVGLSRLLGTLIIAFGAYLVARS